MDRYERMDRRPKEACPAGTNGPYLMGSRLVAHLSVIDSYGYPERIGDLVSHGYRVVGREAGKVVTAPFRTLLEFVQVVS